MPFNMAEARLKNIERLQKQLKQLKKKYELECFPRKGKKTYTIDAHSHNKCMKDLMRLSEENISMRKEIKKLKDQNEYLWEPVCADDYIRLQRQFDELKEENASLRCKEMAHMTQAQIIKSHEWLEWEEYRDKCQRRFKY